MMDNKSKMHKINQNSSQLKTKKQIISLHKLYQNLQFKCNYRNRKHKYRAKRLPKIKMLRLVRIIKIK